MSDTVLDPGAPDALAWPTMRSSPACGDGGARHLVDGAHRFRAHGSTFARHAARLALAACCVAAIVFVLAGRHERSDAARLPMPAPNWQEIEKPVHIFDLEAPLFAKAPMTYAARRHQLGTGREDVLTFGRFDRDQASLRLRLFRRAGEDRQRTPLFAALAHEAAQVGLSIARSGLPDLLPTRFGRFEIADLSLAGRDGVAAPCSGFRLLLDAPALAVTGLACESRGKTLSHAELACLLERLDVAAARDDRALVDFFAASELRRNASCAGMRLGPDALHAAWLDDGAPARPVGGEPKGHTGRKPATAAKRLRRR